MTIQNFNNIKGRAFPVFFLINTSYDAIIKDYINSFITYDHFKAQEAIIFNLLKMIVQNKPNDYLNSNFWPDKMIEIYNQKNS